MPNRHLHHKAERLRLENFCDRFSLEVCIPEFVNGTPGGPFAEQCRLAPISRIPVGLLCDVTVPPSLLDYALSERGVLRSLSLSWDDAPADHAWLFAEFCGNTFTPGTSRKSRWNCVDDNAYSQWVQQHCPEDFSTVEEFHAFV